MFIAILFFLSVFSHQLPAQDKSLKAWKETAYEIRVSDPDSSFALANLIYSRATNVEDTRYAKFLAGYYYYRKQRYDTAYFLLDEVAGYLNKGEEKGLALRTIGSVFLRQQNFSYAERYFNEALAVFAEIGSLRYQFYTLNDLGMVWYDRGDYTRALEFYSEAKSKAIDAGLENQLVRLNNNIVGVYSMLAQYNEALDLAYETVKISRESDNLVDKKTALTALGYVHQKLGNIDSAIYYNERALVFAEQADDFFSLSWQFFDKGDLYLLKKDYKAALEAYLRAVAILEEGNAKRDIDQIKLQIAEVYLTMNEADSALKYTLEAHQFATDNNIKWSILKSSESAAKIYAAKNNHKRSNDYYSMALAFKDSIYNEENQQQFANQRVKLETLEKVKEIEILKREADIAEIKKRALFRSGVFVIVILLLALALVVIFYSYRQKIQRFKAQELNRKLEENRKDLHLQAMHMIRINNYISELEEGLKALKKKYNGDAREVQSVLSKFQINKSLEKEWDNFNIFFLNTHPEFIEQLKRKHPHLTQSELRLCTLIKLNLTNSEISSILNIEAKSVRMSKYRLKKRMGIAEDVEISEVLSSM